MPARSRVDRPISLHTTLPESVAAQLKLALWSPAEQRIPKGAYQEFILQRIQEFFEWERLEIAPGEYVSGPREVIAKLAERLS